MLRFVGAPSRIDVSEYPHAFSPMETRLAADSTFMAAFVRPLDPPDSTHQVSADGATLLGADTLFNYTTPDRRYILAVYRRRG